MIILSIGSNLRSKYGDRFNNLRCAISFLKDYEISIIKESSIYETPAYPDANDPKFLNIIISIESNLSPQNLMKALLEIEDKFERKRIKKNDPRTCDIDIIDYNGEIINFTYKDQNLTIPHNKLSSRNFVLYPLSEILPYWKHPKTKVNISDLIDQLPGKDRKSILKIKKN